MSEADLIEWRIRQARDQFLAPEKKRILRPSASRPPAGHRVELIVRKGQLRPDTLFTFDSDKISRLEARIEAEKAAREAGWPIIGRLHDINPL